MNHISYLKRIRFLHGFLLLCAVTLTACGTIMGGVAALAFSFIVVWRYHRCPKCGGEVDTRLTLDKKSCCPLCGYYLKDGTEPEAMREERERKEAEEKAKAEAEAEAKAQAEAEAAEKAENPEGEESAESAENPENADGASGAESTEVTESPDHPESTGTPAN